ncbi:nucleotide exchange factor GrpE [Pelagibacteraceae bacterium]|jgi:molecular chaperone GrpE|nr:nucleotide exchange factor GrpE [Pelagibacteraceae bacterium]|tara:strand:- start:648 stop:1211 length:564 start_codon:yes stop_codon:yes gene_type:complete
MENKEEKEINKSLDGEEKPSNEAEKEVSIEDKLKETEDKLLRALAEIENQRRRFEKETKDAFEFGGFNFAKETLNLLDNLQRAKLSIKDDEKLKNSKELDIFIKNFEIVEKDLISIFEKNNIKKIECIKKKFDPNLHQAMLEIEDDSIEAGIIIQEVQSGYMFGERLLRPSFVGVSKKKQQKKEDKN